MAIYPSAMISCGIADVVSYNTSGSGVCEMSEEEFVKLLLDRKVASKQVADEDERHALFEKWVGTGNQLAFNVAAVHLLKQGRRSVTAGGACGYLGEHGNKCAVGALILDELQDPGIECKSVWADQVFSRVIKSKLCGHPGALFLAELQDLHDFSDPMFWLVQLSKLAKKWKLDDSALNGWVENAQA